MTSGMDISPREKQFIEQNKDKMFPAQIAKELSDKFPLDNGGYRSSNTVKKVLKS